MISFNFGITNPWSRRWKNAWHRSYETPFEHKFVELELFKDNSIVSFAFRLTTRQHHPGLWMELGLLGYSFSFNFYDSRHWNNQTNTWEIPEPEHY